MAIVSLVMKMYKKLMMILLLCLTLTNVSAIAQDEKQYFEILGDSKDPAQAYQAKRDLIKDYQTLVEGLDSYCISEAIQYNLVTANNVSYENHTIKIILGDGLGPQLKGELASDYCQGDEKTVETHFFFWELFQ